MTEIRVLRREAPKPVPEIVAKLRELLAQAETGELRELLVYYADTETMSWDAIISDIPICIGLLHASVLPYLTDVYNGIDND